MRRLIATHVTAMEAFANAPVGYSMPVPGCELRPGRIISGPMWDNWTSVALVDGDDGGWLRTLAVQNGGKCRDDIVWSDQDKQAMETAVRIMCEGSHGAALNAVMGDYPELAKMIMPLHERIEVLESSIAEAKQ